MLIQQLCDTCKAFYESPVMAYQADGGANFCVGLRWCTFCYGSQIQITRLHAFLTDPMHQIVNLLLEKITLLGLQLQVILPKPIKDDAQPV